MFIQKYQVLGSHRHHIDVPENRRSSFDAGFQNSPRIDLSTVFDAILANKAKITANAWDFGGLGNAVAPLKRGGLPH